MTHAQHRENNMGSCATAAEDCKGSADYAQYAFRHDDEENARKYVRNLESNLSRLKGEMASLDRANRKIKEQGPEATE